MLAVGLLPFLAFGLLALVPMLDTSGDDPTTDEDTDTPDITTVTVTDGAGVETVVEFDPADAVVGQTATVEGTATNDTVVAPNEASVPLQINTLDGDDTISFGFGASVDPGEGTDQLNLTLTSAALSNDDLSGGTVDMSGTDDALAIDIEDAATGFLHEVRFQNTDTPDATTTIDSETLIYVLSQSDTLTVDTAASEVAGNVVFVEATQVLVELDLGSETTVTGTDAAGNPTSDVTGAINTDPTVLVNRDIATEQVFVLPTPVEPVDPPVVEPAPLGTIATDGGAASEVMLDDPIAGEPARLTATDTNDVVIIDSSSDEEFTVDLGTGDDTVSLGLFQDVDAATVFERVPADDQGADSVTMVVRPETVLAIQTANATAAAADVIVGPTLDLGPLDSLTFEIDPTIQGQLVQVNGFAISTPAGGDASAQSDTFAGFYLVPDTVLTEDIVAAMQTPDFDGDVIITQFGGVGLGTVFLGSEGQAGNVGEILETWDTTFDLADIAANRAITVINDPITAVNPVPPVVPPVPPVNA